MEKKLEFDFEEAFTEYELSQIREAMKQEAIAFQHWFENNVRNKFSATEKDYDLYIQSKTK